MSETSYEGWWSFAYQHDADIAALCEAIGMYFADVADRPLDALPPQLRRVTIHAAQIKRDRARRKK